MNKYYAKVRDEFERLVEEEKHNPELTRQATKDIHCLLDIMANMEILRMVDGLDESHSNDYNEARHGAKYHNEYQATHKHDPAKAYEVDDSSMIKDWSARMENADGTKGPHWTISQTAPFAEERDIHGVKPEMWNIVMNMMYSDYYPTAKKHNVNTPDFYADLARDFLTDEDAGDAVKKVKDYYTAVVR